MSDVFTTETLEVEDRGYFWIDLRGKINGLRSDEGSDHFHDFGLLYFKWGYQPDLDEEYEYSLSSAPITDQDGNEGTVRLKGLPEDTEIHYRAIGEPVNTEDYGTIESIATNDFKIRGVSEDAKAVEILANSEDAMNVIGQHELAINTLSLSETARAELDKVDRAIRQMVCIQADLNYMNYGYRETLVDSQDFIDYVIPHETAMRAAVSSDTAIEHMSAREEVMSEIYNTDRAFRQLMCIPASIDYTKYEDIFALLSDGQNALDTVWRNEMSRTIMLLSHQIDTMWSKEMASEKFWANFEGVEGSGWEEVDGGWDADDSVEVRYGGSHWSGDSNAPDTPDDIATSIAFRGDGEGYYVGIDVDLTDVSKIEFYYIHHNGTSDREQNLKINDEVVFSNTSDQTTWTKSDIDVSDISGTVTLKIGSKNMTGLDSETAGCCQRAV